MGNWGDLGAGEIVFPKEKHTNWLSSAKKSDLKKKHASDIIWAEHVIEYKCMQ